MVNVSYLEFVLSKECLNTSFEYIGETNAVGNILFWKQKVEADQWQSFKGTDNICFNSLDNMPFKDQFCE